MSLRGKWVDILWLSSNLSAGPLRRRWRTKGMEFLVSFVFSFFPEISSCGNWLRSFIFPGPSQQRQKTFPLSPQPQAPCEYLPSSQKNAGDGYMRDKVQTLSKGQTSPSSMAFSSCCVRCNPEMPVERLSPFAHKREDRL